LKPATSKPPNRARKKIYGGEAAASLRLIWTFFWYTSGTLLTPPLIRQQMRSIAHWPTFGITPAAIDRAPKGKSLTKPGEFLNHRIPIRVFYTSHEHTLPGFIQIDTAGR
jgi:hypothetical protein